MNATKSLKRNYIYNLTYQILNLIIPLITTPYLARILTPEGIGLYSVTAANVAYFIMFAALGTLNYGNREISFLQHDREKRTKTFWEIEFLSIICVAVCLIAYGVFLGFYRRYFALYLIQTLSLISVAADITWLLQGMEEFGKVIARNIIFKVIIVIFIFTAIHDEGDLPIYILGLCILEFLSNFSVWFYLPQYVDKPSLRKLRPFSHFKATFSLFIPTVATTIYTRIDITMIHIFSVSTTENGYYEQATKLSKIVLTLVTALGAVMIPRIGRYFSEGKKEEARELLYESFRFIWFLGLPLCFGLIGISSNFVPWFFGTDYMKVIPLLWILAFLIPIIGISNVIGIQYLITTKRENLLTRSVCFGAIINFLLNLIMIPIFYSIGAAITSVIAEMCISAIQLFYIRKEFSFKRIFFSSKNYLLAGIPMLILLVVISQFLSPNFFATLLLIIVGVVIYFGILLILRDSFVITNCKQLLQKIHRN